MPHQIIIENIYFSISTKEKIHQDLCSSSTRTPKNTNPYFKHKNTCPDFLAFFLPFLVNQTQTQINLQQEHKHKPNNRSSQIFSNHKTHIYKLNHNSNPDFLIFQSTTKPPANKIHKPRKFSIKKKKKS